VTRFVTVAHAGIDGTGRVPEQALDHYRSLGWLPVDQNPPEPPGDPHNPAPSDTPIGDELAAHQATATDPAAVTEEP
jgi:hypothetical protein